MSAIVASKEAGGLQLFTYGAGSNWKELITETSSDMLAQLELFIATQDMSEKEMLEYDLNINSIKKAREQYKKIAKRVGISADALSKNLMPATEIEKLDLKECIYAGLVNSMFKHNGSGIYSHIGGSVKTREISNRSVVRIPSKIIFGDFFRVEYKKGGQDRKKDIIEHVTTGTLSDIGRVALHLSNWELGDFRIKNGQITQESRQFISGIDLGIVNEIPAEPSPQLRQWIKEIVIENPGPAQKKLRKIKKTLEKLAHLAKDPVPQLTQDNLLELIEKSIPEDITDHTVVDNNLRLLMESEGIELEKFVEKERQDRIISNAPEEITTEGFAFKVSYKSSVPYIRVDKFNSQQLAKLESDIFLDDHRQVKFLFEHKYHALHELQEKLAPTV
jgi:hypothetical protein